MQGAVQLFLFADVRSGREETTCPGPDQTSKRTGWGGWVDTRGVVACLPGRTDLRMNPGGIKEFLTGLTSDGQPVTPPVPCGARPVFYYDPMKQPGWADAGGPGSPQRVNALVRSVGAQYPPGLEWSDERPALNTQARYNPDQSTPETESAFLQGLLQAGVTRPQLQKAAEGTSVERDVVESVLAPPSAPPPCIARVYNNSTIPGLADRAADELRQRGWNVPVVSNYNAVDVPESAVYFRPGTQEEGAARALAAQLGVRALPRFEGIQNASPGVIVMTRGELRPNVN